MNIRLFIDKLSNKLFIRSLITFGLRGFGILFLFGFTILMTRNFNPTSIGEYEFARVFLLISGSIVLLGTDISVIYFSGRLKGENSFYSLKQTYYQMVKIVVITAISAVLLYYVLTAFAVVDHFLNAQGFEIVKLIMLTLPFYALTILNTEAFRALDYVILSELFRNFFKYIPLFVGVLLLLFTTIDVFSLALCYAYGFVILFFVTQVIIYFLFRKIQKENATIQFTDQEVIKHSFPMGVSNIIMFLLLGIDVFLLKQNYGNETVAFYSIAIKLITILSMVILSITINCAPKISEYYVRKELDELQRLCKRTARITFGINLLVALGMVVFLDQILGMFGEQYISMKNTFYILVLSQLFTSALGTVPIYLNMTGRSKVYQNILLLTLVFNLGMNVALIPLFSTIGAAITFSCSVVLWNLLVAVYVYKKDKVNISFI